MLYLLSMNELTIKEIADKLNITQQAAKMRLFRLGVKPVRLIGQTGIYDPAVIEKIRTVLPIGRPRKVDKPVKKNRKGNITG
jgi:hypothetical protein